jgi:hypothetical protein
MHGYRRTGTLISKTLEPGKKINFPNDFKRLTVKTLSSSETGYTLDRPNLGTEQKNPNTRSDAATPVLTFSAKHPTLF